MPHNTSRLPSRRSRPEWRDRSAPEAFAPPNRGSAREYAALPHRHGGVRWGASPEPATQGVRPRRAVDACPVCSTLFEGEKNDFRNAEAIAEAVLRPTMKFVAIKTVEQLDLQALHRVRERLVCQRTRVSRGLHRGKSIENSPWAGSSRPSFAQRQLDREEVTVLLKRGKGLVRACTH